MDLEPTTQPPKMAIIGCGPGAAEYVTEAARRAAAGADVLVGSRRLLDLFPMCCEERIHVDADIPSLLERIEALRAGGRRVAVLVAGDPGLYSLAQNLIGRFGSAECEVVPAVSSVQVAFARLGLDWADARIISAHGRLPGIEAGELAGAGKIAILAGTKQALVWSAQLAGALGDDYLVFLAENLTLAEERFRQLTAEQLAMIEAASLSIVLLIRRSLLT
ncbi:MAG: precorrin-6y C5,15-methyltransferase (decarboxylating) subunit CbiE [Thermoguttaceae bacterium]